MAKITCLETSTLFVLQAIASVSSAIAQAAKNGDSIRIDLENAELRPDVQAALRAYVTNLAPLFKEVELVERNVFNLTPYEVGIQDVSRTSNYHDVSRALH